MRRIFLLRAASVNSGLAGNFITDRIKTKTALVKNLRRHRALFSQEAKHEMFGANVSMLKAIALFMSVSEHSLGFGRERQFNRSGNLFPQQRATLDFLANRFNRNLRTREEPAGESFVFTHQPQKQVLRFNCRSPELRRFVACEEDYPASFFCVAFKHWFVVSESPL